MEHHGSYVYPLDLSSHLSRPDARSGVLAGWKAGLGGEASRVSLGLSGPLVGRLVEECVFDDGAEVDVRGWTSARIEPELAVRIGADMVEGVDATDAIAALIPAFELVDIDGPLDDARRILDGNIYHRGIVLGTAIDALGVDTRPGFTLHKDTILLGALDDAGSAVGDIVDVINHVAAVVRANGELVRTGHIIMTGSVVTPVIVGPHEYVSEFRGIGSVRVRIRDVRS